MAEEGFKRKLTAIRFAYQSYAELWSEWIDAGILETHVKNLQARDSIKLE
jgi:hypothetical protein